MKRLVFIPSLFVFIMYPSSAAEKQREWQTGKVLDTQRNSYFAGTVGTADTFATAQADGKHGTYSANTTTSQVAMYRVYETFQIEGETYAYLAQERLHWKWSKPANLTVNGPVKFAVENRKLFVIDDDGKEHEMEIIKKVLAHSKPSGDNSKEERARRRDAALDALNH